MKYRKSNIPTRKTGILVQITIEIFVCVSQIHIVFFIVKNTDSDIHIMVNFSPFYNLYFLFRHSDFEAENVLIEDTRSLSDDCGVNEKAILKLNAHYMTYEGDDLIPESIRQNIRWGESI